MRQKPCARRAGCGPASQDGSAPGAQGAAPQRGARYLGPPALAWGGPVAVTHRGGAWVQPPMRPLRWCRDTPEHTCIFSAHGPVTAMAGRIR